MHNRSLVAHDLSIGYDSLPVVSGVRFFVPRGKVLGLVGVNGSGKSTLLKTIAGLLEPISGSILWSENRGTKAKTAYLAQSHAQQFLLPISVRDVVRMSRYGTLGLWKRWRQEDHDLVQDALKAMKIEDLAGESFLALSGGQRQRVLLAFVLAQNAEVVLLDEPTLNLDLVGQEDVQRAIEVFRRRDNVVVVSTHNVKEALGYDQTMLLSGKVVAYGKPQAVLTPENLLETFGIVFRVQGKDWIALEKDGIHHDHEHP